jgi:hypothetical protein
MLPMAWMALRAGLPLDSNLTLCRGGRNRFANDGTVSPASARAPAPAVLSISARGGEQLRFPFR